MKKDGRAMESERSDLLDSAGGNGACFLDRRQDVEVCWRQSIAQRPLTALREALRGTVPCLSHDGSTPPQILGFRRVDAAKTGFASARPLKAYARKLSKDGAPELA